MLLMLLLLLLLRPHTLRLSFGARAVDVCVASSALAQVSELFINTGGQFVNQGDARGLDGITLTSHVLAVDLTLDGVLDLFLARHSDEQLLLANSGTGQFSPASTTAARTAHTAVVFDSTNTGVQDVLVAGDGYAAFLTPRQPFNSGRVVLVDVASMRGFLAAGDEGDRLTAVDFDLDGDGACVCMCVDVFCVAGC